MISAAVGVAVSLYLFVQHTRLESGIQDSASFCTLGAFADCDVVNTSQFSEIFGIPLAAIGACFYFLVLLLGLLAPPKDNNFRRFQRAIAWLVGVGLGIDLVLFVIQLVKLNTLCLMCFLTYLCSIGILTGVVLAADRERGLSRWKSAFTATPGLAPMKRNVVALGAVGLAAFAGVLALIPGFIRSKSQTYSMVDNALVQFYQTWKDKPQKTLEVTPGDGTLGNAASKVRIVEFSDFECPFCQRTAFTLHTALRPLEGRVHFVYKYFPLDQDCNPAMTYQLHPHACALARLGVCAERKGKFWQFHDHVFLKMSEEQLKLGIDAIAPELSSILSRDEITKCLQDSSTLSAVMEDIKLGNSLGIKGTPTLFINGKQVTIPITPETLNKLVEIEASIH